MESIQKDMQEAKRPNQNQILSQNQYIPKSKIANEGGHHGKYVQKNPMAFQLNNIYYKNINVKSYTHQSLT